MNLLPPEPSANDKISATFMKALMRYIRANTLLNGPGYRTKRGPNGTTLEIGKAAHARQAASALQPWTFTCTEDPDTQERTGGWTNCILQLGYHKFLYSEDLSGSTPRGDGSGEIGGTSLTDDGEYCVEVDTKNETAEIKLVEGNLHDDIPNSIVRVWIGEVKDGEQISGIHHHPVVYKYI